MSAIREAGKLKKEYYGDQSRIAWATVRLPKKKTEIIETLKTIIVLSFCICFNHIACVKCFFFSL